MTQQEQENNSVAPRSRLRKKKPWEKDIAESGKQPQERKKSIGPAPSISPLNGRRNRSRPWSDHDAKTLSSKDDDEASLGGSLGDLDTSFGECNQSSGSHLRTSGNNSSAELKVDELEEATKVLAPSKSPPPKAPVAPLQAPAPQPAPPVKPKSKKADNHNNNNNSNSKGLPNEPTLEELLEQNKELLAIDFDRDGHALREAIQEDTLAMWESQDLYENMPELRMEICKGIVEQKFESLRQEQARVLEKKQLLSMPKLEAVRMDSITEEEEEEDSEEEEPQQPPQGEELEGSNQEVNGPTLEELEASMSAEEKSAFRAFRVQEELERRLQDMDRSEQNCVEATGRQGELSEKEVAIRDYHAWNKYKLHDAVHKRVSQIFTGHHKITTSSEEKQDEEDSVGEEQEGEEDGNVVQEMPHAQAAAEEEEYEEEVVEEEKKDTTSKARVRATLTNSFSKFEELLAKKNQPAKTLENDDEWTECEEITVVEEPTVEDLKKVVSDMGAKLAVAAAKDYDEESFMEYTVHEETTVVEADDEEDGTEVKEKGKTKPPPLQRITRPTDKKPLNRLASTDSSYIELTVAEGDGDEDGKLDKKLNKQQSWGRGFPSITLDDYDDDDMTQITFDQTMDENYSTTPDHALATAYLNNNNTEPAKAQSPPRKAGSITDSQTMQTFPMDESSVSHRAEGSLDSGSRDSSAALSKQVSKILRVEIWSPKEKVVQSAMERLASAASQGTHQRANISRLGGVIAIVRSMQSHPRNVHVQVSACQALGHLSVDNESQEAICEVGGRGAIVAAMLAHPDALEVQQAACRALASITRAMEGLAPDMSDSEEEGEGESSGGSDVVRALVQAMNKFPRDAQIQAKSFGSLANLCLDNKQRLQELSDLGGFSSMTLALQRPWENKMEQHEAISTLSILLRSLTELGTEC